MRRVRRVGRVLRCRRDVVEVVVVVVGNVVDANRFTVIGLFVTCAVLPA